MQFSVSAQFPFKCQVQILYVAVDVFIMLVFLHRLNEA